MNRCFTHYWKNATCRDSAAKSGQLLDHIGSNLFHKRGIGRGDRMYAVTVLRGRLFLIGRLSVATVCCATPAARILGTDDLWPASEHIVAASATPMCFDLEVPLAVTQKLLFAATHPSSPLRISRPGHLDRQTLRGVRELDPVSATLLEELLPVDTIVQHATNVA
jgi:hypothetical protein